MPSADRHAHAVWEGDLFKGKGEVELVSSGAGNFPVSWASRVEQPEGQTSPEELVAAAHASCYAMAFSNVLASSGNTAERLSVNVTVSVGSKEGGGIEVKASKIDVSGKVPGLDQAKFQELAEEGEKGCPISNALRGNVQISVDAKLDS
jgi:osmotically inducible protein OsmC